MNNRIRTALLVFAGFLLSVTTCLGQTFQGAVYAQNTAGASTTITSSNCTGNTCSGTSMTVYPGNLLVGCLRWSNNAAHGSDVINDAQSLNQLTFVSSSISTDGSSTVAMYVKAGAAGSSGAENFVGTLPSSLNFTSIVVRQYSGIPSSGATDSVETNNSAVNVTGLSTANFGTPAQNTELVVGCNSTESLAQTYSGGTMNGVAATNKVSDSGPTGEMTGTFDWFQTSSINGTAANIDWNCGGCVSAAGEITAVTFKVASPRTFAASDCQEATVQALIYGSQNGDTINMPSCSGGVGWHTTLTINTAIILGGVQCTTTTSTISTPLLTGGTGATTRTISYPTTTGCSTRILDQPGDLTHINTMISWTMPALSNANRMHDIRFDDGTLNWTNLSTDGTGQNITDSGNLQQFASWMVNSHLHISSGTGLTPGDYTIDTFTDSNHVHIAASAGASGSAGVAKIGRGSDAGSTGGDTIIITTNLGGSADDGRRFRFDHLYIKQLLGNQFRNFEGYGLFDHMNWEVPIAIRGLQAANTTDYAWSDARWNESISGGTGYGTQQSVVIEDSLLNAITSGSNQVAITDGWGGTKQMVRFNDIRNGNIQNHGTESAARARGGKIMEVYRNQYTGNNSTNYLVNVRSGVAITWGQQIISGYQNNENAAVLNNQRTTANFDGWDIADGTSPWDVNPGSPTVNTLNVTSWTHNGDATDTITFTGTGFPANTAANTYQSYSVHISVHSGVTCVANGSSVCGGLIDSHTACNPGTCSFVIGFNHPTDQLLAAINDTAQVWLITHILDGSCRSAGDLLVAKQVSGASPVGLHWVGTPTNQITVNMASGASYPNIANGDHVAISQSAVGQYNETYAVASFTGNPATQMVLTAYNASPGDDMSGNANITRVFGTAVAANNQVTEGCYQWGNVDQGNGNANLIFGGSFEYSTNSHNGNLRPAVDSTGAVVATPHWYDYNPALGTFDGTITSNHSPVGYGTLASRPATCTTGVFWFATDQGSWNTAAGTPGGQGIGYKCTATNTWTAYYTPLTYPHPLDVNQSVATPVHSGMLMGVGQ